VGKEIFWISPSLGTLRPEFGLNIIKILGLVHVSQTEMNVGVVLDVVNEDLVAEDNAIAFLSVLVAGLDLEGNATGGGTVSQFKFLAGFILFGALF
jgi:hypothetical protein